MSRKTKIIISDTHIGAGGAEEGNKLEDFISDAEFVKWLHELVVESDQDCVDMELIINGDWIEFLQIPSSDRFEPHRPYDTDLYTEHGEAAALARLQIVNEWHPGIFLGLADFLRARAPCRTITILYGNHDPELAYPGVQERIRQMVNATGQYANLIDIGSRIYFEDGVYIEHGNAYVESLNRFSDPDHPFDPNHPKQVERPTGSHFVTYFFNQVEWQRPWIDGVHPMTSMIFYALAFEPRFALDILKAFLSVAPDIFKDIGLAGNSDEQPSTGGHLLNQINSPEQREHLAQQLESDPAFAVIFTRDVQQALIEKGAMEASPEGMAGSPGDVLPIVRAREITEQYWHMLQATAEKIALEKNARVVLFGHIHEAIEKRLPSGALYLNTGTWVWKGDFREASDELWQDLVRHPEKYMFARKLSYARIDYTERGNLAGARLEQIGETSRPPLDPGPQPKPSFWTRLLLSIRGLFTRLFA